MNLVQDIITYIRRIIKSPSNAQITDSLLIDYINRFWIMDVDARMQLFDLKTKYAFETQPGVDQYNMPLYDLQIESPTQDPQSINYYPVYQGFVGPTYVNGVEVQFYTQKDLFFRTWPNIVQQQFVVGTGNGSAGPYTLSFPIGPNNTIPINPPIQAILRGHVDLTGIVEYSTNTGSYIDPIIVSNLSTGIIPSTSIFPAVYLTSTDATGANVIVQDSGQFMLNNVNYGLFMVPGNAPFGYAAMDNGYLVSFPITGITQASQAVITTSSTFQPGQTIQVNGVIGMTQLNTNTYTVVSVTPTTITINVDSTGFTPYVSGGTVSSLQNVINYFTGVATNVYFPVPIPDGVNISAQCYLFQCGLPRSILYYNNTITLRSPPASQYLIELDAYLTPAAFLASTNAVQFAYMAEYIARGAARKILSDTGDQEQLAFYEPLFKEQELLVWKRSQRQWTATRTQTIYSQGTNQGQSGLGNFGSSF